MPGEAGILVGGRYLLGEMVGHAGPLRELIAALLAKDPAQRPDSQDVLNALAGVASQPGADSRPAAATKARAAAGDSFRSQGRYADAEVAYREAIRLDPGYTSAHNNLEALLRVAKRPG